ncbi:LOW QUALITY PROTEIN: hypothetical protein OSB04_025577 [Centaurea solstitialis]|uniref:Uncharacterized protein n=1 Tax=Centaurea solstitialis TaxID=347529 RepID=A0AA38WBF0_9ASTR|nr:LOW QUALITY PROTEIN: hypothetical protein OSB04_025577 [Centaurea solstitialis]
MYGWQPGRRNERVHIFKTSGERFMKRRKIEDVAEATCTVIRNGHCGCAKYVDDEDGDFGDGSEGAVDVFGATTHDVEDDGFHGEILVGRDIGEVVEGDGGEGGGDAADVGGGGAGVEGSGEGEHDDGVGRAVVTVRPIFFRVCRWGWFFARVLEVARFAIELKCCLSMFREFELGFKRSVETNCYRLLWVVRSPSSNNKSDRFFPPSELDLDSLLPEGFMDWTRDRGMVVKSLHSLFDDVYLSDWCTYMKTLFHSPGMPPIPPSVLPRQEPRVIKAITDGLCLPDQPTPSLYTIGSLVIIGADGDGSHDLGLFSSDQLKEIATRLDKSGKRFLWVVRSPPSENKSGRFQPPSEPDLDSLLPEDTRHRDGGERWALQVAVLNKELVGGFRPGSLKVLQVYVEAPGTPPIYCLDMPMTLNDRSKDS